MDFSGLEALSGASANLNDDGSFSVTVDKSQLTQESAGSYDLMVSLGDEKTKIPSLFKITINVKVEIVEPPPEEPEPEEP